MKKIILLPAAFLILIATGSKQSYKYVEFDGGKPSPKEKQIEAASDSDAYIEAYKDFCISLKVNQEMQKAYGQNDLLPPTSF